MIIIYPQPICKTCKKVLNEWDAWIDPENQEHSECAAKRIAEEIFMKIKKQLKEK